MSGGRNWWWSEIKRQYMFIYIIFASYLLFIPDVQKADAGFCMDYRAVVQEIVEDRFPLGGYSRVRDAVLVLDLNVHGFAMV